MMVQEKKLLLQVHLLAILVIPIIIGSHMNIRAEPPVYKEHYAINISMPNIRPIKDDSYVCTAKQLDFGKSYIVQYEPSADVHRAHHMLLFGCKELDHSIQPYPFHWNCVHSNLCEDTTILYAWAKNAPPVTLPEDVGFEIGGNSSIHYIILQLHYAKPLPEGERDTSGLTLHVTRKPQRYIAGIHLLLADSPVIPPHRSKFHVDVNCYPKSKIPIHPFAYRVHSHALGVVITGYKYTLENNSWTMLAKGNPQWPQAFYPMDKIYTVLPNEVLALRCTYNSSERNIPTYMGSRTIDEMCNLYIMYYTSANGGSSFGRCIDVELPDLTAQLPADNDIPLPPNVIWEGHAEGQTDKKKTIMDEKRNMKFTDSSIYYDPYSEKEVEQFNTVDYHQGFGSFDLDYKYKEMETWSVDDPTFGQITAVNIDSHNNLVIFHRGNHIWTEATFDYDDKYIPIKDGPIAVPTIVTLDLATGHVLHQWGSNLFFMPHGLTVQGKCIWLTDVALHQVFKFCFSVSIIPELTLGEKFEPGSDHKHFCKPTSVAVSSNGDIYVADGYCNSRIVRFSDAGEFLSQWGQRNQMGVPSPPPGVFTVPHKLTLIEEKDLICVADRENGRIQCFTLITGKFRFQITQKEFGGKLFSIDYSPSKGGLLYAVCGASDYAGHVVQAFVFNFTTQQLLSSFSPKKESFTQPHDITVTRDAEEVFISEIGPNKVWKFAKDIHKSMKKVLAEIPPSQTVFSIVNTIKTEKSILHEQNKSKENTNSSDVSSFGTSMIIMALLAIPVLILIIITAFIRLRKKGKLHQCSLSHIKGWLGGYRTPHPQEKFNFGTLLNPHKGFDRVAIDESDIDGEGSGSEVEEFNAVTRKA